MLSLNRKINLFLSKIKSGYINFRYLPLKYALKQPLLIDWRVKVQINDSIINFDTIPTKHIFQYGIQHSPDVSENSKCLLALNNSVMNLSGTYPVIIRGGSTISCQNATISFGGNFFANSNLYLKSDIGINIGNDVMFGYDVSLRDSDGHVFNGEKNSSRRITIGDNIWINAKSDILKGVQLKSGSVVGYRALVTSSINDKHHAHSLIAGIPARCVKKEVDWSGLEDFFGKAYQPVEHERT